MSIQYWQSGSHVTSASIHSWASALSILHSCDQLLCGVFLWDVKPWADCVCAFGPVYWESLKLPPLPPDQTCVQLSPYMKLVAVCSHHWLVESQSPTIHTYICTSSRLFMPPCLGMCVHHAQVCISKYVNTSLSCVHLWTVLVNMWYPTVQFHDSSHNCDHSLECGVEWLILTLGMSVPF